jgi:glutaredoxin
MRRDSFLLLAALTCPCHVPLLVVLLAGTAVSGLIADNLLLFFAAFGLLFAGSLWLWARAGAAVSPSAPSEPPSPKSTEGTPPLQVQLLKTRGCARCASVQRDWETLRPRYEGRVQVQVVDLLDHPEVAERCRVLQSPAIVIDGRLRAEGPLNAARLRRLLDEALRERDDAARLEEHARA